MSAISLIAEGFLLGTGLAMDAFSVSVANGLLEPKMPLKRSVQIAGCYGIFQGLMPLLGWALIHTAVQYFRLLDDLIPWIALALLGFLGIKMIIEGVRERRGMAEGDEANPASLAHLGGKTLLVQAVATSIDALSVGVVMADAPFWKAFSLSGIIALVTFGYCMIGLKIGKTVANRLKGLATIFGGVILILIGLQIFISNL